jgi:hypothetical protein
MFNRQYSSLTAWRSIASGSYHALQLTLRERFSQGVQFDINYTWANSIDLASRAGRDGSSNFGITGNPSDPGLRRAVFDCDMTRQFNTNWIVEFPFGKGKRLLNTDSRLLDAIIGGWQLSGLWRQTSGLPASVGNCRNWPTNSQWQAYATQVGVVPPPTTVRNGVRGDGYFTIDTGFGKRFLMPYSEKHSFQFRWEVFNTFNAVRFDARHVHGPREPRDFREIQRRTHPAARDADRRPLRVAACRITQQFRPGRVGPKEDKR